MNRKTLDTTPSDPARPSDDVRCPESIEASDFASSVLCGREWPAKLLEPRLITDEHPRAATSIPDFPARPAGFEPRVAGERRPGFPSRPDLKTTEGRRRMLHDFAHHELLATETFAWALLRFPDAPRGLRLGWARIMRDEIRHFRMYIRRMHELGDAPIQAPASRAMWDTLTRSRSPAQFIAGMGLGFEQANLDFAVDFRAAMRAAGDDVTAAILERVHADEIRHVRFARLWFARLTNEETIRFDAWAAALPTALKPRHGRGVTVDVESRLQAGFDRKWIERIEIAAASKGRPPRVFVFNPECDDEVLHGATGFTPSAAGRALARDLDMLFMFAAKADDVVLVDEIPAPAQLREVARAGFEIPSFRTPAALRFNDDGAPMIDGLPAAAVVPWGVTPLHGAYDPRSRRLYAKSFAAELAERLAAKLSADAPWREHLAPIEDRGLAARTMAEAEAALARVFALHASAVIKADFSTAGRARRVTDAGGAAGLHRWILQTIERHGAVVIEPWLDRTHDLSFHFRRFADGRVRSDGISVFETSTAGAYKGARIGPLLRAFDLETRRFLQEAAGSGTWLTAVSALLAHTLAEALAGDVVTGPLGIDAFLYRPRGTVAPSLRLRPLVELNPRWTMGRIALNLARRVKAGQAALWRHVSAGEVRRAGFADLPAFAAAVRESAPLRASGHGRQRQAVSGVLFTTEVRASSRFTTVLAVGEGAIAALQGLLPTK